MSKWLLRGVVFATAMVIARLLQGALINFKPEWAVWFSSALVIVFAIGVFFWGFVDGIGDARKTEDPDRRADLAMTWLVAGLFAGVVSGAVMWLIGLVYKSVYVEELLNEITTFAAFTALVVFLAAVAGVTVGRWLVDRKAPPAVKHDHADDSRADTDVFAAVSAGAEDVTNPELPQQQ